MPTTRTATTTTRFSAAAILAAAVAATATPAFAGSVAREWDEALLEAIRFDTPRPTVHARNLFHTSAAMYDAWAAYDATSVGYLVNEHHTGNAAAREEAISYAAYHLLKHRFAGSPGGPQALPKFDALMAHLGYDPDNHTTTGNTAAAVGNRIAESYIRYGLNDGANEINDYADNTGYAPKNPSLNVAHSGAAVTDPNHWQPLIFPIKGVETEQHFLTPQWGGVKTFAAGRPTGGGAYGSDLIGNPPKFGTPEFASAALEVIRFSSRLDPDDGVVIDISPAVSGNSTVGTNDGKGYAFNPATGQPYEPVLVKQGDWGRVLAEFWADGPKSETPPGHWNVIANEVADHPDLVKKIGGTGKVVSDLEWDVKVYLALNAASHDAAVATWDLKTQVDYVRPITMIRYMGGLGQSSDATLPSYNPHGLTLEAGLVELVTAQTAAVGGKHEGLEVGSIAIFAWRGHPDMPSDQPNGVGWIAAEDWVPFQAQNFVTPPFPGYVSGHSTFSRAMAEVLAGITGSPFFPGGFGQFLFEQNQGLQFEAGPTADVPLQWATYFDASDEAGLSRLYGGIHVRADDFDGRILGHALGPAVYSKALSLYNGSATAIPTPVALPAGLMLLVGLALRRGRRGPAGRAGAGPS